MRKLRYSLFAVIIVMNLFVAGLSQAALQQSPDINTFLVRAASWDAFSQIVEKVKVKSFPLAPAKAKELVADNPDNCFIIDVRAPSDYEKGHAKGAVNIPNSEMPKMIDKIPTDKPLLIYCYTGQSAALASMPLQALGYNVFSISRGYPALEKAGFETSTMPVVFKPATNAFPADEASKATRTGIIATYDTLIKQMLAGKLFVDGAVVKKWLATESGKYILVDLRASDDYRKAHVKGAINIPLAELAARFGELSKDKTVVVYCYTGQTAALTLLPLKAEGYNVVSIGSGFEGVKTSGLELEK